MKHRMVSSDRRGVTTERCCRCGLVVRFRRTDDGVAREWGRGEVWTELQPGERPPECDATGPEVVVPTIGRREVASDRVEAVLQWYREHGAAGIRACASALRLSRASVQRAAEVLASMGLVCIERVEVHGSIMGLLVKPLEVP